MALWEEGGVGHIYGIAELVAYDSYSAWFRNFFDSFPDLRFEVIEITAEDDRAAVQWRSRGTFDGSAKFEGFEPNGKSIDVVGCDVLTIRDGKLTANHAYTNSMELARQLGAMPPQGSGAEKAMAAAFNLKTKATKAIQSRRG